MRFLGFLIEFDISKVREKDNPEWFIFSGSACYWVAFCEYVISSIIISSDKDE